MRLEGALLARLSQMPCACMRAPMSLLGVHAGMTNCWQHLLVVGVVPLFVCLWRRVLLLQVAACHRVWHPWHVLIHAAE